MQFHIPDTSVLFTHTKEVCCTNSCTMLRDTFCSTTVGLTVCTFTLEVSVIKLDVVGYTIDSSQPSTSR